MSQRISLFFIILATSLQATKCLPDNCFNWCMKHVSPWRAKCAWKKCTGCAPCLADRGGVEVRTPPPTTMTTTTSSTTTATTTTTTKITTKTTTTTTTSTTTTKATTLTTTSSTTTSTTSTKTTTTTTSTTTSTTTTTTTTSTTTTTTTAITTTASTITSTTTTTTLATITTTTTTTTPSVIATTKITTTSTTTATTTTTTDTTTTTTDTTATTTVLTTENSTTASAISLVSTASNTTKFIKTSNPATKLNPGVGQNMTATSTVVPSTSSANNTIAITTTASTSTTTTTISSAPSLRGASPGRNSTADSQVGSADFDFFITVFISTLAVVGVVLSVTVAWAIYVCVSKINKSHARFSTFSTSVPAMPGYVEVVVTKNDYSRGANSHRDRDSQPETPMRQQSRELGLPPVPQYVPTQRPCLPQHALDQNLSFVQRAPSQRPIEGPSQEQFAESLSFVVHRTQSHRPTGESPHERSPVQPTPPHLSRHQPAFVQDARIVQPRQIHSSSSQRLISVPTALPLSELFGSTSGSDYYVTDDDDSSRDFESILYQCGMLS